MNKLSIGSSYIDAMKEEHQWKRPPTERHAVLIGSHANNIGGAIAKRLQKDGFKIQQFSLETTGTDATSPASVKGLMKGAAAGADTLILNQGFTYLDWIERQPLEKIQQSIEVNLTSPILCCAEFVKNTIDLSYKKHIVIIGSMGGKAVLNGSSPYCAAKAGLIHFAKCIGWELAPKGYDVFVVNPSNVENAPMSKETIKGLERYLGLTPEEAKDYWGAILPRKDWLQMTDIAKIVSWLVSGEAAYLSGSSIDLTGGQR